MRDECLISLKERDFGGISGRLEYISFLSEKGLELARGKEILSAHAKYITDKTAESIFIDHDLLVNWFQPKYRRFQGQNWPDKKPVALEAGMPLWPQRPSHLCFDAKHLLSKLNPPKK